MHRIRDLREDRDLTQADIAKVLQTTQQQYSKIETGRADISGEKLKRLAVFYNISADYILGLTDVPPSLKIIQKRYRKYRHTAIFLIVVRRKPSNIIFIETHRSFHQSE